MDPPAQVVPPREGYAAYIKCQEDFQRDLRTTGRGNRRTKAARDQVATASADRADKSQRSSTLNAGRIQGERPTCVAQALCFPKLLLSEDCRNHPIGRAVANPGRDEEYEKHRQETREILGAQEIHDTD